MPTIKDISGPFRLFFYSLDCLEPIHVHAERDRATCKFWMEPVTLASNHGFSTQELSRIRRIILERREQITEAWNEHCNKP